MLFELMLVWFGRFAVAAKLMELRTPFYLKNLNFQLKLCTHFVGEFLFFDDKPL